MNEILLDDGRRLCYREAGSGPVLVLLHGWSMSSAVFTEVTERLAGDFRIIAPDLSGHGFSEPGLSHYDHDTLSSDVELLLAHLGIECCSLLGWSLGGQVAIRIAGRRRVEISRLILVATTPLFVETPGWENGLPLTQVRAMDRQIQRHYEQSMGEFFRLMFEGEELADERYRQIIRFAVREGKLPEREVARHGLKILGATDLREEANRLSLPVLIHYGSLDLITAPGAPAWLAAAIPGAQEARWEGVGHAPFLSRPDESVALWKRFLL